MEKMNEPSGGIDPGLTAKGVAIAASAVGAAVMAATKPPESRMQLLRYGIVSIGSGFLFAELVAEVASHYLGIPATKLVLPAGGLVGAVAWGVWGYARHILDQVSSSDEGLIPAIKKAIFG
jgi:hypothetical protein